MPPTLGQRLKHAREKRGLTLRDVEHMTRISVARLQDLEEDKLNTFGGPAYARSFLRTYAALLDVSADDVLSQLKPPPLGGVHDYRYLVESQGPWIAQRRERPQRSYAPTGPVASGRPFAYAMGLSFVFAVLIGGVLLANGMFSSKSTAAAAKAGDDAAAAEEYTVRPAIAVDDAAAHSREPFSSAPESAPADEEEFTLVGVSLTMVPDKSGAGAAIPAHVVPPKAQPVTDPQIPVRPVPKAVPVR